MMDQTSVGPKKRLLREALEHLRCVGRLARGALQFSRTGRTPSDAYHSLIWLHCRTNGRSNDVLHALARRRNRSIALPPPAGVLGSLSADDVAAMAARIRTDGFTIFPQLLAPETVRRLTDFAMSAEAKTAPPREGCPPRAVYDRNNPIAEAYRFDEASIIANPDIQSLMADLSIIAVAQAYLHCLPVLSAVAMWWSTSARFASDAKTELAQMYHFDMDRLKWIKFFIYLTDVTPENGPHCFIAKTHRAGKQRRDCLDRGYVRLPDEDLEPFYPVEDHITITGPAGTIFAADTRGYHKGVTPRHGDRLLLQLEFCDSLFGAEYGRPAFPSDCVADLAERRRQFPRVYSRYT
jgi:hypothetical protein